MTKVLKIDGIALEFRAPDSAPAGDLMVRKFNGIGVEPTLTKIGRIESRMTEADIPEHRYTYDDYEAVEKHGGVTMDKATLMVCLRALVRTNVTGSKITAIKMLRQYMGLSACGLKEAKEFVDSL